MPLARRTNKPICKIDMSAFVAILFVLAAIFWLPLAAPHHGVGVDLPKVSSAKSMRDAIREDAMFLAVMRDGTIFFDGHKLHPSSLPLQIRLRIAAGAEPKVYIRADARSRYGAVADVLDGIRASGITNIAFLVHERRSTADIPQQVVTTRRLPPHIHP